MQLQENMIYNSLGFAKLHRLGMKVTNWYFLTFPMYLQLCYPLPNDKLEYITKLNLNIAKMKISLSDKSKKHCWEKEGMMMTSIFSFSHSVFLSFHL